MLTDTFGRPLRNLRLSVTDRCNLRCSYCMPEEDYRWLPREDILQFEELGRVVDSFLDLGVDKIRLTGGEPLLRRELPELVSQLARRSRVRDLAMTTNGVLLAPVAQDLKTAGLHRVTISLDTLHASRFRDITRSEDMPRVLEGIAVASQLFPGLKLDMVVIRGVNDDELGTMIDFGRTFGAEVRFIEYMDVGGATQWSMDHVVPRTSMIETLTRRFGAIEPVTEATSAPAQRYRLADGTVFGIISSTTQPFCGECDRSRLTADGMWYLCLYAREGVDVRRLLRGGAKDADIRAAVNDAWTKRTDRGAEQRLASRTRPLIPLDTLRRDPHLEMHTRGG